MPAASSTENNPSFAYAAGDLIASKYLLEERLGEGGMGAVFRARNTSLDMRVAIKLLRADLNRDLLGGRLLQEARAAAKLAHPAIVRVFDVGQTALGDPFIVMELLEGDTLSALIDREQGLTPIHAVQLLLPIADALSAAHAKGLVHRDVKPDNVIVVSDEGIAQPKLLDFGIVKLTHADGSSGASDAGSVFGSPDYMSPEQARGLEQVDSRSDLWSFSVVLYEAIAAVAPFQSNNYNTLLRMIVEDTPKSLKELGVADHALSYIVERGLNKSPTDRYASLSQMGRALAAWLADQGITEDACGVSLEAKWLGARQTDPGGLGRKSWPPPARTEQVSGVHDIQLIQANVPALHTAGITIPPASLAPTADSNRSPEPTPRRSPVLVIAAASVLALSLAVLGFASLRSQPQPAAPAAIAAPPAAVAADAPLAPPPVAIASTVKPVTPPEAETAPTPPDENAAAEDHAVPPSPRQSKPVNIRRPAPKSSPAPRAKPERPSDLLAPMPF